MRRGLWTTSAVLLILLASVPVWGAVTLNQPQADTSVGQFVDVAGTAAPRSTVSVSFEVGRPAAAEAMYAAPPTLVEADAAGAFKLRLALPTLAAREGLACKITVAETAAEGAFLLTAQTVTVRLAADPMGGAALDPNIPTVNTPVEGTDAGPASEVDGRAKPGELVVISTRCYDVETGELVKDVPGIRHYPRQDGSFHFRVATPRVVFGREGPVWYEMRIYSSTPGHAWPALYIHLKEPQ